MNPSEKNKLYNKYLAGDITKEEMHRLNQYALDDDFLFDALEGVSDFESNRSKAISDLEARLSSKKKKVRPLYFWLSAVAGVAIIVFALNVIQAPSQEVMSDVVMEQNKQAPAADEKSSAGLELREADDEEKAERSIKSEAEAKQEKDLTPNSSEPVKAKPKSTERSQVFSDEAVLHEPSREPTAVSIQVAPAPEGGAVLGQTSEPIESAKQDVVSEDKEIAAVEHDFESIKAARSEGLAKPTNANFDQSENKATAFTPRKKVAKAQKRGQLADDTALSAPIQESESADEEAIVLFNVIIVDEPILTESFRRHVLENFKLEDYSGEFKVEFSITEGKLSSEIKILKSNTTELDEKLIKLIESFEEWEGSGNKTLRFLF